MDNMEYRVCPKCGIPLSMADVSCRNCGTVFYQEHQPSTQNYNQQTQHYQQYSQYPNQHYQQQRCTSQYQQPIPQQYIERNGIYINNHTISTILSMVGLLLCIISVFLPYVSISALGYSETVSILDSTSDSFIILAICVVDAIVILCRCKTYGIDTIVTSIILAIISYIHIQHVQTKIDGLGEYSSLAKMGSGLYVLTIGALCMLIGGITLYKYHKEMGNLE